MFTYNIKCFLENIGGTYNMSNIGIDIGTTNIKIIETNENLKIKNKAIFARIDPNIALENFVNTNNINMNNVEKIAITGIGTDKFTKEKYKASIIEIPEFIAIGNCGKIVLKNEDFVVASAGTGTAFIKNKDGVITHMGGTGIGGGTLINLCKSVLPNTTFKEINEAIQKGNLANVDLKIKDVTTNNIATLPKDTTAVNFGKLDNNATKEDIVLGIVNMIFETIGVMSALIAKGDDIKKIIVTGQIAKIPYAKEVLNKIEILHNVEFIIPENAEYMTALGAIFYYNNKNI